MHAIAERHGVPLKAAALQFVLANPALRAVIPGASRPERIVEDVDAFNTVIPARFWDEMRAEQLVAAAAPLPIARPVDRSDAPESGRDDGCWLAPDAQS